MIPQVCAAMMGTIAFSLLFGVPRKYYIWCGLIGGAGWAVYVLASGYVSGAGASFAATVVVIFLSRAAAVVNRCPVTIFLISGIFPLVPGAGIYWTVYYLVTEQLGLAVYTGYEAVKAAVAIVLGIVFVFECSGGWRKHSLKFHKVRPAAGAFTHGSLLEAVCFNYHLFVWEFERLEYIDGPSEKKVVDVAGTLPYYDGIALCVAADDETDAVNREEPTV